MSNIIDLKRDSLEAFIREQMIGPNGCRGKFSYQTDSEDSVSIEEVVNTTPGSIYSTAILFPKQMPVEDRQDSGENRKTSVESSDESSDADEVATSETAPAEAPQQETNFELYRQEEIDDEDIYSLSRRFPHAIGMSCCLAKEALTNENLRISISGRYYKKSLGQTAVTLGSILQTMTSSLKNSGTQLRLFISTFHLMVNPSQSKILIPKMYLISNSFYEI